MRLANLSYGDEMGKNRINKLTLRQKECLALVGEGYTSKEIAQQLNISPSTVDNHLRTAMTALEATSRADAARQYAASSTSQQLTSQPETLGDGEESAMMKGSDTAILPSLFGHLIKPPPIGGKPNEATKTEKLLRILQVAFISLILISAIALLISGILTVFS